MRNLLVLLAVVASAAAAAVNASADYGTGTVAQVEISANSVQGGSFWFWGALGPGTQSDYQETDCIHTTAGGNPPSSGGQAGAAHDGGSLISWSDSGGIIEMNGVEIIGGLETATIWVSDSPHSNWMVIEGTGGIPILPFGVQLPYSGKGVQVQVAP